MQHLRKFILLFFVLAGSLLAMAQPPEVIAQYIDTYKKLAIEEMLRTGVPASIKLAQGIHETFAGTSVLVTKSNNHFGIKCKNTWTGESVSHDDDARGECFRKYPSAEDSYRDHSNFLKSSSRYASLFELDPMDYQGWANGLKKAGYATNPKYPSIIIKLVEDYHLQDYTLIALGKMKESDVVFTKTETSTPATPEVMVTPPEENIVVPVTPSYPDGEFKINETKVVFIKKGTPYLTIAQQYNIPLARIFEFNDMNQSETAATDQLVYLQRKRKTGNEEFHTVKPGESLRDIAQVQAIRLETLLEYNWLKESEQPAIGEKLSLRSKSTVMPKLALKNNYSIPNSVKSVSRN
ncbi:MAG TPA: glucosaminidase domain-containing protein [Chitinophagaceae bacterium]